MTPPKRLVTHAKTGSRGPRRLRFLVSVGSLGALLFAACGGNSLAPNDPGAAGEATVATSCNEGDTRRCVGPGACDGGQVCLGAKWTECDCGSSMSNGGGGQSDAGSPGLNQAGQTQSAAGAGGSAPDNIDWDDDPCSGDGLTNGERTIDCSGDCPGFHPRPGDPVGCAPQAQCQLTSWEVYPSEGAALTMPTDFAGRTPRASTIDGPCDCPAGQPIFAKFRVHVALTDPALVHLTVRAPWHFGTDSAAACTTAKQQCAQGSGTWNTVLWTESANAPAVNVPMRIGPCE
jgi:hypothetical protein